MSVPKSKRKESRFEANHNFYQLRGEVTTLTLLNFGFSVEKYNRQIERYAENHKSASNCAEVVARYKAKSTAFNDWFISEERKAVIDMLRVISIEFTIGNSIFPSKENDEINMREYCERRLHLNRAIAQCFALKQEM